MGVFHTQVPRRAQIHLVNGGVHTKSTKTALTLPNSQHSLLLPPKLSSPVGVWPWSLSLLWRHPLLNHQGPPPLYSRSLSSNSPVPSSSTIPLTSLIPTFLSFSLVSLIIPLFYWQIFPSNPLLSLTSLKTSAFLYLWLKRNRLSWERMNFLSCRCVSRHRVTIQQGWCERDSSHSLRLYSLR